MGSGATARPNRNSDSSKKKLTLSPVPTPAFSLLERKAIKTERENRINGWGYIISGTAVMAISIPAYYATKDVFAQAVYTIGQTLGLGAITYGATLVLIDDEYVTFYNIIKDVPGLAPEKKEILAREFFQKSAIRAKQNRKIRVIGHSLGATLNFINAATASNSDLRAALYFLGGINTLAAFSYLFRESDEEKAVESLQSEKHASVISPLVGPVVGLQIRF